jgi:ABC-type branched-subunit amino acid transport system substrate-binding protein
VLDSKAITKVQSIILIAIIAVAAVGGAAAYVLLDGPSQSSDTIKIGVLADLDLATEEYNGAILAAEQINAEGGLLGRQVEVFGEDDDGGLDPTITSTAINRLITVDNVDFIIGGYGGVS